MPQWRKGDPYYIHPNPEMLEGVAAIATYLGVGYNTADKWIKHHQLPATRTWSGRWITTKHAVLAWMLEGVEHSPFPLDPLVHVLLTRTVSRVERASAPIGKDTSVIEDPACPYTGKSLPSQSEKVERLLPIGTGEYAIRS
jgi:hypothetical protein